MLSADERWELRRVISSQNDKGGVGKTSVSVNLAAFLADGGYKTLLIDLDPQGDVGDDLGYRRSELDDDGMALFNAVAFGSPLEPVKNVRPNLDVVPAGRRTEMLIDHLQGQTARGVDATDALAARLAQIAGRYDVVILDTPPGEGVIQTLALTAARWILIPTQPDDSSLHGLAKLAERVAEVRPKNPELRVLGVVLFPMVTSGTRILTDTRDKLTSIMGGVAPVFSSSIRHAQASAVNARRRGQTIVELARDAADQQPWYQALRAAKDGTGTNAGASTSPTTRIADSASSLAGDYFQLTKEVLTTLGEHERAEAEKGERA